MSNKQLKITSDTDFSGNEITNAIIDGDKNKITGLDGYYHPKNDEELREILDSDIWGGNIDFSAFDFSTFEPNGYTIEGKTFNIRNFTFGSSWSGSDFKWFKKPMFTLNGASLYCFNFTIDATNIEYNTSQTNPNETAPLIQVNDGGIFQAQIGSISIGNVFGINKITAIELNDAQAKIYIPITIDGSDEGNDTNRTGIIIESNNTDNSDITTQIINTQCSIFGFSNSFGIKYNNDYSTRVEISRTNINTNGLSLVLPNNSELELNYSSINKITAIDQAFITYEADQTYDVDDILKWIDPNDENHIEYLKVLQQFNSNDYINNIWQGFEDGIYEHYYNIRVYGTLYAAFDPDNKITNFETHDSGYKVSGLQINNYLNMNDENYNLPVNSEKLEANNVRDAIKELAEGRLGSNLYDIKLLSQAVANKGWVCLGYDNRQDINKNIIPTAYNDILNKYDNADGVSTLNTGTSISSSQTKGVCFVDDKWFIILSQKLYYTTDFTNLTLVDDTLNYHESGQIICGENIIMALVYDNGPIKTKIFNVADLTQNKIISDNQGYNRSFIDNGTLYFTNKTDKTVYSIPDNYDNANGITELSDYTGNLYDLYKDNNNYYALLGNKVMVGTDITDINSFSELKEDNSISVNSFIVAMDNFIAYLPDRSSHIKYSFDNFATTLDSTDYVDIGYLGAFTYLPIIQFNNLYYNDNGTTYSRNIFDFNTTTNLSISQSGSIGIASNDTNVVFTANNIYYIDLQRATFTDTYFVNGNSVDIEYYRNGSFKICLKDGDSNDDNLDTIYNALGYANYFVLDTEGETLALPRNSNLWTFMYVGDNYENGNLPSGNYIPNGTLNEIVNTTSTTDTLTIEEQTRYTYTQSLSSLTITLTSVRKAEIYFTSGTSATLSLASGQKFIGSTSLTDNTDYVLTVNNGIIRIDAISVVS